MLNSNQRKVLIVGLVALLIMGVFPPWMYTFDFRSISNDIPVGYRIITSPPEPISKMRGNGVKIDISRLIIQWLTVSASTGLGILLLSNKKENGS